MSKLTEALKKPWVVMPLLALVVLSGWFVLRPDTDGGVEAAATTDEQIIEATVGAMSRTVTADGTVAASESEELSFSSSGTVTAVDVQAGDTVQAGDVLAEIDSAELAAAVSTAEASLAEADAKLADDVAAGSSDAQHAADQASITSAQDQLDAANQALDGAQLVASFDATVASVDISVGEELSSGGASGTGLTGSASGSGASASTLGSAETAVPGNAASDSGTIDSSHISLVSTGSFTVDLGFDDSDIADLAVGQVATVSISTSSSSDTGFPGVAGGFPGGAFPGADAGQLAATPGEDTATGDAATEGRTPAAVDEGIEGLVTDVGAVADASSGVASYPVTIVFSDDSGDFNVGASVSVSIAYAEVDDAIQVPAFAVTTADGASTVQVSTDGDTETRTVTTGLTSGTMVQITSGLDAGESVVVSMPGRGNGADGAAATGPGAGAPAAQEGGS